jgi:hypothetical protein
MLRFLALICLGLGLAGPAAAQCYTGRLHFPNKPADGEHTIGAVETDHGKLEVRVNVKDGVATDPSFYLRAQRLTKARWSEISANIRACLQPKKTSASEPGWLASAAGVALEWLAPEAEAAQRCRPVIVDSGCFDHRCCARACCYQGICGNAACVKY